NTIDAGTSGDVTLNAGRAITDNNAPANNITADVLTADAVTGIDLDTTVATANLTVTGAGSIDINEADAIDLLDVDTANGAITVTAGGALTASDVAATGGADTDDITLQGTSIEVDTINAAGLGDVSLTATGGAIDDADTDSAITADALTLNANTTIGATNAIGTTVNSINLTSGGDIAISEADSVTITGLVTSGGADTIGITVAGASTIDWNVALTDASLSGDNLDLTTGTGGTVDDNGNNLNLGLTGTLDIIADTIDLTGTLTAGGGVTVAAATANASIGLGNLASAAVTGQDFVLSNGTIVNLINAGSGTFSVGDASSGDVVMEGVDVTTATGAVTLTVQAGTGFGIEDDEFTVGIGFTGGSDDALTLISDGAIGSNSNGFEVDTGAVTVNSSGGNNVTLSDQGGASFDITYDVTTGGAGNVSITQISDNLAVNQITTTGNVTLDAQGGAITDANGVTNNISANGLTADAATGIDLDTTVASVDLSTTGIGDIDINEADALTITDITTFDGSVTVATTNGTITATNVVAGDDNASADEFIDLTAGGATSDIDVNTIDAGTSGDVTLNAGRAITDNNAAANNITADVLTADAVTGIDLDTT
ncbi:MAG: hypothetical protein MJA83_20510, partial [Gammaproteobacteria bacterium]|nr:hypothetical protein [Gammaproteobacteria bacterium]